MPPLSPPRQLVRSQRVALLVGGCLVLGTGVALLLTADLGADGYTTLVSGVAEALDAPFWLANLLVGVAFVTMAAVRRLLPGPGTVVQVVVVGLTVTVLLEVVPEPAAWPARIGVLALAFPVLALGIATYLGSRTGAGPAEGAALAWDPPVPFRWTYSVVQGGGALVGWLLGATVGAGTLAVILLLGPLVDLTARALRLDVHQGRPAVEG